MEPLWTWQQPGWPGFRYDPSLLAETEARYVRRAASAVGVFRTLAEPAAREVQTGVLADHAWDSSAIEGELLNRESVRASLRRQLGLDDSAHRASPAEVGIAELMLDLFQGWDQPLTEARLWDWHRRLMRGREQQLEVGRFRTHPEPMQVVSGPVGRQVVHFEAPPSPRVPQEMEAFLAWFAEPARPLSALARAGIAHLWFETIHPFEDGNGRLGRAVADLALSQGLGHPCLTALSGELRKRGDAYYQALRSASLDLKVDGWLAWFGEAALAGQEDTLRSIEFVLWKTRYLDQHSPNLNPRQLAVLKRMLREGAGGFQGGLSAANYRAITGAPTATTTRDLAELVALGALRRTGENKGSRYWLPYEPKPFWD